MGHTRKRKELQADSLEKWNFSSLRIVTIRIQINSKSSVTWMRQNKSIWDFWEHQCSSLSKFSQGFNPSKTPWSTRAGSACSQNSLEMDPSLLSTETKKKKKIQGEEKIPPRRRKFGNNNTRRRTGEISRAQVHPELIFQVFQLQDKFGKAAKGVGMDQLLCARTRQQLQFPFAASDWTKNPGNGGRSRSSRYLGMFGIPKFPSLPH